MNLRKVVSGGQTGADRAALDAALAAGFATGGWVPRGRVAEDGRIPDHYLGLRETAGDAVRAIRDWLAGLPGDTLNVAGPRASRDPAIFEKTREIVARLLQGDGCE